MGEHGGQRRPEEHHGKGEQGHQPACRGDGYLQVAGQARQQADDEKFGGNDEKRGEGQDRDAQCGARGGGRNGAGEDSHGSGIPRMEGRHAIDSPNSYPWRFFLYARNQIH